MDRVNLIEEINEDSTWSFILGVIARTVGHLIDASEMTLDEARAFTGEIGIGEDTWYDRVRPKILKMTESPVAA